MPNTSEKSDIPVEELKEDISRISVTKRNGRRRLKTAWFRTELCEELCASLQLQHSYQPFEGHYMDVYWKD